MPTQPTAPLKDLYIRLPADLHAAIKQAATDERRTLNQQVITAIEQYLLRRESQTPR